MSELRRVVTQILHDPAYLAALKQRAINGTLCNELECLLWEFADHRVPVRAIETRSGTQTLTVLRPVAPIAKVPAKP